MFQQDAADRCAILILQKVRGGECFRGGQPCCFGCALRFHDLPLSLFSAELWDLGFSALSLSLTASDARPDPHWVPGVDRSSPESASSNGPWPLRIPPCPGRAPRCPPRLPKREAIRDPSSAAAFAAGSCRAHSPRGRPPRIPGSRCIRPTESSPAR